MATTAGIVIIGDEILAGKFADENAPFLIGELRRLGVSLRRIAVILDDLDEIAATVREFSERFDVVFTSGGLGPTHDDLTIAGIARGFDTSVVVNPRLEKVLRDHWGPAMPEANLRLAQVPEGAELVGNASWPVVCYRNVYILPGVPALFRRKFSSIKERFRSVPVHETRLYCLGDEGNLAPHLNAVAAQFPAVKIGSYPRFGELKYRVIVTLECDEEAALISASDALRQRLSGCLVDGESKDG